LKERYEVHHGVRITDGAIVAATQLSERYITDRFLPDKAIDLIDEAASKLRIEIDSMPEELDTLERKVKQLEIEREAFGVKDEASAKRLEELKQELSELNSERTKLRLHWDMEKEKIQKIRTMKSEIEGLKLEAERFEREGNLGKVAEIRYGKIVNLEKQLKEETKKLADAQKDKKMLKEEVDAEDIAEIVSKWTGIPVSKMLESKQIIKIRRLHHRVVGQDEAVIAVANAIRRSRRDCMQTDQLVHSYFWTTALVKQNLLVLLLNGLMTNTQHPIDRSRVLEKLCFKIDCIIARYVGYEEGEELTEAVRRRNTSCSA
jgi:ATP-dependent Clp protease ATP-binding subunit ClpB